MSEKTTIRRADKLRVGDIIMRENYPADLIEVSPLASGRMMFLRWGEGPSDCMAAINEAPFTVYGES